MRITLLCLAMAAFALLASAGEQPTPPGSVTHKVRRGAVVGVKSFGEYKEGWPHVEVRVKPDNKTVKFDGSPSWKMDRDEYKPWLLHIPKEIRNKPKEIKKLLKQEHLWMGTFKETHRVDVRVRGRYVLVASQGGKPGAPGGGAPKGENVWTTLSLDCDIDADSDRKDGVVGVGDNYTREAHEEDKVEDVDKNPIGAIVTVGKKSDLIVRRLQATVAGVQSHDPEGKPLSELIDGRLYLLHVDTEDDAEDEGEGDRNHGKIDLYYDDNGTWKKAIDDSSILVKPLWQKIVGGKDVGLKMEGVAPGRVKLLALLSVKPRGAESDYDTVVEFSDKLRITVLNDARFGLATDIDGDGSIDADSDSADHKYQKAPGGWVLVNDDNDNKNTYDWKSYDKEKKLPLADVDETQEVKNEDDLKELRLLIPPRIINAPSATVTLTASNEADNGTVKVWLRRLKSNKPLFEKGGNIKTWSWSPTNAQGKVDLISAINSRLWVEGVDGGDVELKLEAEGMPGLIETDTIKLLVVDDHNEGVSGSGQGQFGSLEPTTAAVADIAEVNLTSGNLVAEFPVTQIRGNLMPFNVTFYYNSRSKMPGAELGRKFRHNYEMCVHVVGAPKLENSSEGGRLLLIEEDGQRVWFIRDRDETERYVYKSESRRGLFAQIEAKVEEQNGRYEFQGFILKRKGNLFYEFDADGRLFAIMDLHGGNPDAEDLFEQPGPNNAVSLAYYLGGDNDGKLKEVVGPFKRKIKFSSKKGEITVTDPTDAAVTVSLGGVKGKRVEDWTLKPTSTELPEMLSTFTNARGNDYVVTYDPNKQGLAVAVKRPDPGKTLEKGETKPPVQAPKHIEYVPHLTGDKTEVYSWHNKGETQIPKREFTVDYDLNVWTSFTIFMGGGTNNPDRTAQRKFDPPKGGAERLLRQEVTFGGKEFSEWEYYEDTGNVKSSHELRTVGAPATAKWEYEYHDTLGLITKMYNPAVARTKPSSFGYTQYGDLAWSEDPLKNRTEFRDHDDHGRALTKQLPKGAIYTYKFGANGDQPYMTETSRKYSYRAENDNLPRIQRTDTRQLLSSITGWPLDEQDWRGHWIQRRYDELGNLRFLAGPRKDKIKAPDATSRLKPPDGDYEEVTYVSGTSLLLTSRNRGGGTTTYKYDDLDRPWDEVSDIRLTPKQVAHRNYVYDGRDNMLKSIVHDDVALWDAGRGGYVLARKQAITTVYTYNHADQRTSLKPPQNSDKQKYGYEYYANGRLQYETNPLGHKWEHKYWPNGMSKETIDPLKLRVEYREYYKDGKLKLVRDALREIARYVYSDARVLTRETVRGVTKIIERDAQYAPKVIKTPHMDNGYSHTVIHTNELDWIEAEDLADNGTSGEKASIRYLVRNKNGDAEQVRDASGLVTIFTVDAKGLVKSKRIDATVVRRDFLHARWRGREVKSLAQVAHNNLGVATGADIGVITPIGIRKLTGLNHRTTPDLLGRARVAIHPDGKTSRREFDVRGNLVLVEDENRHKTRYLYDLNSQLVRRHDPDGAVWCFAYDVAGRFTSKWEASFPKNAEVVGYDDSGRIAERRDGSFFDKEKMKPRKWTYTYYNDGQVDTVTDALGQVRKFIYHDDTGRLYRVYLNYRGDGDKGYFTQRTYYSSGQVKRELRANGDHNETTYDRRGRVATVKRLPEKIPVSYSYEDDYFYSPPGGGQVWIHAPLVRVWDPKKDARKYHYSPFGGVAVEELRTEQTGYVPVHLRGFDAAGRLVSESPGNSKRLIRYERNARGLLGTRIESVPDRDYTLRFTYYDNGQLETLSGWTKGGRVSEECFYDEMGRLTHKYDYVAYKVRVNKYNRRGAGVRSTLREIDDKQAALALPPLGSLAAPPSPPDGEILLDTVYGHDGADRLTSVTQQGKTATLEYDASGRLDLVTKPNGIRTRRDYDRYSRLRAITHKNADGEFVAGVKYRDVDRSGNVRQIDYYLEEATPYCTSRFNFGRANRLDYEKHDILGRGEYQRFYKYTDRGNRYWEQQIGPKSDGDPGERETKVYRYVYQDDQRLLRRYQSADPSDPGEEGQLPPAVENTDTHYGYDSRANCDLITRPVTLDDGTFGGYERLRFDYSPRNYVTSVFLEEDVADPQGLPGGAERTLRKYEYNAFSWQKTRVQDFDESGAIVSDRTHVYDGASLEAEFDDEGRLVAHHAGRGIDQTLWSVRTDFDADGNATGKLSTPLSGGHTLMATAGDTGEVSSLHHFFAYGEELKLAGSSLQEFEGAFQGRHYNSRMKLYDYRLRTYDPQTGRFLQPDPVADPENFFNAYAAMGNNPRRNIDPMGNDFIDTVGGSVRWNIEIDLIDNETLREIPIGSPAHAGHVNLRSDWGRTCGVQMAALKKQAGSIWQVEPDLWRRSAAYQNGAVRRAIGRAIGDRRSYSLTPGYDFSLGVAKTFWEPVALVYTGGRTALYALLHFRRMTSADLDRYWDSALFQYGGALKDQGHGWGGTAVRVFGTTLVRGNPVGGMIYGAVDMYQGFSTGDYERAGGGAAGFGMSVAATYFAVRSGGVGQWRAPTIRAAAAAIRTNGFRAAAGAFIKTQTRMPTFRRWGGGLRAVWRRGVRLLRRMRPPRRRSFIDGMAPDEAARYRAYWERAENYPTQGAPYQIKTWLHPDGKIKTVQTYNRFGHAHRQYGFSERNQPFHQHNFIPRNTRRGNAPVRERTPRHRPVDE